MKARSDSPQLFLLLGGAAALTVLAITRLPPLPDLLRAPSTPLDRSASAATAPAWRLLRRASSVIPPGASVAPLSEPRNAVRETFLHREAVALLPGRKVIPAALWYVPTHTEYQAEFLLVIGPKPASPPGDLLLETPDGTVWRRLGR